jgi:hypothetical protein
LVADITTEPFDTHTDTGLTNGQEYCYKVTSYHDATCESGFSTILCAPPPEPGADHRSSRRGHDGDRPLDQVLVELLLERAKKNLVEYRNMDRQFQAKYGGEFETWRQSVPDSDPPFQTEQDYFDWEMAVTGIADMREEIERLESLKQQL